MAIRQLLTRVVGERTRGRLGYVLRIDNPSPWGGPFNGQRGRQRLFRDLMASLPVSAIVETGTYRATTTELFAATGKPVFTVEAVPRQAGYAAARLRKYGAQVHLGEGDSRAFLRRLATEARVPGDLIFFYLDAHWERDLPLAEEVEIALSHWPRAVIMVDDFHVPDTTYEYDDYGPDMRLTLDYLRPVLEARRARAFFPSLPAEEESGARRGTVVLAADADVCRVLDGLPSLVAAP